MFLITFCDSSEQTWTVSFTCKGALGGQQFAQYTIARDDLTFGNLITTKSNLGVWYQGLLVLQEEKW